MRFFLLFLLVFSSVSYAKNTIDTKINKTSKKLKKFDKTYANVDKKLAKTAKAIIREERTILKQEKKLQELQLELSLKEEKYQENSQELNELNKSQLSLQANQKKLQEDLVFMLAKNVSLSLLLDDDKAKNDEALITEEVFESLKQITHSSISVLQDNYSSNTYKITAIEKKIKKLKKSIQEIDNKKKEVLGLTRNKKKNLNKLKKQKNSYRVSVKKLLKQQHSLKNELSKLNIIKEDEKAKRLARKKEAARLAKLNRDRQERATPKNLPKVKSRTDAYSSVKTKKYRGKKTISPLDSFTVVKKFGPYEDPIYHIKIFNESISLKPKSSNAKVKSVLNGKVILSKKTSLLNNIVIIEHDNGMHTIYARLDKVAPTIKKGKRLKRGSIIGRVNEELMFEVTQKNFHINPLQLIAYK